MTTDATHNTDLLEEAMPHLKAAQEKLSEYHRQVLLGDILLKDQHQLDQLAAFHAALDRGHAQFLTFLTEKKVEDQQQNPPSLDPESTEIDPFPLAAILLRLVYFHLEAIPRTFQPAMAVIMEENPRKGEPHTVALLDTIIAFHEALDAWNTFTQNKLKDQLNKADDSIDDLPLI